MTDIQGQHLSVNLVALVVLHAMLSREDYTPTSAVTIAYETARKFVERSLL